MPDIETYVAESGREAAAPSLAGAALVGAVATKYTISVRFLGGLTTSQKDAFKAAANRWTTLITTALPAVMVGTERIDGLVIHAQGQDIDGPGKILGQAGPTRLRPGNIGPGSHLPAMGDMAFDTADLAQMESHGTLRDVIAHEMGHVVGIGTVWPQLGLIVGAGTPNPRFTGANAQAEYGVLIGKPPAPIPIENTGGAGTRDSHWRDAVFGNELMTGFVADPGNPLSRMTAASLVDMGYAVDMTKAEPYAMPSLASLAAFGLLGGVVVHRDHLLGTIPLSLPPDSVVD